MKQIIYALIFSMTLVSCDTVLKTASTILATPTTEEAAGGLKDALKQGIASGVDVLSAKGGFNNNSLIRIMLPEEAKKIETTLRNLGMSAQVDKVITTLNEGAENAVMEAKPIFVDAITKMSFQDAMGILTGGNGAATNYLKSTTTEKLTTAFRPVVQSALDKVGCTKYWTDLVNTYNKIPTVQKLNPDLNGYVTEKAMAALFQKVETEENAIRQDPAKRVTDLMKKAFSYADSQKANNQ